MKKTLLSTFVAIFFYGMCYMLLKECIQGDYGKDFIFVFFFAIFSLFAGILFTCNVAEQLIKKIK